jgi:hypothetical protein
MADFIHTKKKGINKKKKKKAQKKRKAACTFLLFAC